MAFIFSSVLPHLLYITIDDPFQITSWSKDGNTFCWNSRILFKQLLRLNSLLSLSSFWVYSLWRMHLEKLHGLSVWWISMNPLSLIIQCIGHLFIVFRFGIFNPSVVYDHLGEIFSALIFGSFIFCFFLYIKVSFFYWVNYQVFVYTCHIYLNFWCSYFFCIQGSCCAIFHWFWFVWKPNNWFLLGEHLQIAVMF